MTEDIVERLRNPDYRGPFQHLRGWDEIDGLHDAAATTIESLRAQLAAEHALGFKAGIEAGAQIAHEYGDRTSRPFAVLVSAEIRDEILSIPTPPSILPEILEAMREAENVFKLVETPAFPDPDFHCEIDTLGRRIGFGALMSGAEAAWRDANAERGTPAGSEFVAGPCRLMVTAVLVKLRSAITKLGGKIDEA